MPILTETYSGSPGGMNLALPQQEIDDTDAQYLQDALVDRPGLNRRRGPVQEDVGWATLPRQASGLAIAIDPAGTDRYAALTGNSSNVYLTAWSSDKASTVDLSWSPIEILTTYAWFDAFLRAIDSSLGFVPTVLGASFAAVSKALPIGSIGGFGAHESIVKCFRIHNNSIMKPLLTVLMPVYNAERFLNEAIESILQQTFSDFEFLIIDDRSTDGSVKIIQAYHDKRIKFYKNKRNLGISATLNKGIVLASTSLIARMDADDISYPDRLDKQFDFMQSHPECALLSSWVRVISEDKKFVRLEKYRSKFYYFNLTFECWMYHPSVMFRKSTLTLPKALRFST